MAAVASAAAFLQIASASPPVKISLSAFSTYSRTYAMSPIIGPAVASVSSPSVIWS